jgi:hypothetical protein
MHQLTVLYFVNQPLHVSGVFIAHHQEVFQSCKAVFETPCISTTKLKGNLAFQVFIGTSCEVESLTILGK